MDVTLVATMLSAIVGVLAMYFTYRALFPARRELVVALLPAVPLLATENVPGVRVTRDGRDLTDPHVVTVTLTKEGRHDITASHFHDDVPLVVDVGTPVEILQVSARPERATPLTCTTSGSELRLGPGLVSRGQQVVVQLLSGGPVRGEPQVRDNLVDVRVVQRSGVPRGPSLAGVLAVVALVATAVLGTVAVVRISLALDDPALSVYEEAVPRGDDIVLSGTRLPEFCPIEVELFQRTVARDQTDGAGSFGMVVHVPKDAPLGETDITVVCRDANRSEEYVTSIAVLRETPSPSPSH